MTFATGVTDDLPGGRHFGVYAEGGPDALPARLPPHPQTVFEYFDRGWRPALGAICGLALAYNFVLAPASGSKETDEGKLWVLATIALGLAGVKTVERVGPQMVRP